jgi:PII-like signaling protein
MHAYRSTNQITWLHIPKDYIIHIYCCENQKFHKNRYNEVLVTHMLNNHTIHTLTVLGSRAGFMNKLDKLQHRASFYEGVLISP